MRKAEEILDSISADYHPRRPWAIRAIEQAQREAIEEAAKVADSMAGEEEDYYSEVIAKQIRALLPHREEQ